MFLKFKLLNIVVPSLHTHTHMQPLLVHSTLVLLIMHITSRFTGYY